MKRLTVDEIADLLVKRPAWKMVDGLLVREWMFADFVAAMKFVNEVAAMAEAAGHHPDIDIRYNRVRLGLVTHDVGGISRKDAAMVDDLEALHGG